MKRVVLTFIVWVVIFLSGCGVKLSPEELYDLNKDIPSSWREHDCFLAYTYVFNQTTKINFREYTDSSFNNWYYCWNDYSSCRKEASNKWDIRNCAINGIEKTANLSEIKHKQDPSLITYENTKFSMEYSPENWVYTENVNDSIDVLFSNKPKFDNQTYSVFISFAIEDIPSWKTMSLNDIYNFSKETTLKGYSILSEWNIVINWIDAKRLILKWFQNKKPVKRELVMFIKNNAYYGIEYSSDSINNFDKLNDEAERMIYSIQVK